MKCFLGRWVKAHGEPQLTIYTLDDRQVQGARSVSAEAPEDEAFVMFSGELYNAGSLADASGVRSASAEELVKELYRREGSGMISRLDGTFALVIYDRRKRELLLATDKLGEQPLFVREDQPGELWFSNRLKPLLKHGGIPAFDKHAIDQYMIYGTPLGGRTPFQGISALEYGQAYLANASEQRVWRYWTPSYRKTYEKRHMPELYETFKSILKDSVLRLRDTGQVTGIAFSGGVDSSGILLTCVQNGVPVQPVCLTYASKGGEDLNLYRARLVADYLKVPMLTVHYQPPTDAEISDIAASYDVPCGKLITLHNDYLCKSFPDPSSVILAGHGADELFAGYLRYQRPQEGTPTLVPRFARSRGSHGLRENERKSIGLYAEHFRQWAAEHDPEELYLVDRLNPYRDCEAIDRVSFLEMFYEGHCDNVSVAHGSGRKYGKRIRSPFLSPDMIEFANAIPFELKIAEGQPKAIPKFGLAGELPREALFDQKFGFDTFFSHEAWLLDIRHSFYEEMMEGVLAGEWLDREAVRQLFVREQEASAAADLWKLLSFERWYKQIVA
ncbi:asparagine synthetase B family protein [Paenibacillus elgii]